MDYGIVYRITCLTNGKCYHGQTVNPKERWAHHLRVDSHCLALRNAIRKYGVANFTFVVVAVASTKEELDAIERQFVATSMAPKGYNIKEGGANGRPSDETRRKLSEANKIAQNRPEVRERNSLGVRAAMARPNVKEKHRAALQRYYAQPEAKEKAHKRMVAVHARPGETQKRRESLRQAWASLSAEERESRISRQKEAYTDELRARLRDASQASMARPEVKEKHKEAVKASWTEARRAEMSARAQADHARPGDVEKRSAAISAAHNTPEGKRKLQMRRRRGESEDAWRARIENSQ